MGKLINPAGLDAAAAYGETLDALVEQMKVRVGSVDNGEKFMRETNERGGADARRREDLRDHRPLGGLRDAVARHAAHHRDERAHRTCPIGSCATPSCSCWADASPMRCAPRCGRCTRSASASAGSSTSAATARPFKITVADLLARKTELEMAYNPNDCVEIRWGATEGSAERATCQRHAPADQLARMAEHRVWFRDAKRPPR